ncbi:MAG: hypothetical protein K0U86_09610 [Planctomycetes bacterium]|nr:hypothetical protein [Planctomycetota bacterium]MCH9725147.1 hypothetical protein [Planctomycetota bacterium]
MVEKSLEGYMVAKFGLAAIGNIYLVAVYQQDVSGKPQKDSQLFHFVQTESFGSGKILRSIRLEGWIGTHLIQSESQNPS